MKKLPSIGINQKMVCIAIFPAAIVALLLSLIYSISQINNAKQSLNDRGFSLARQLASASEYGVYSRNPSILYPLANAAMKEIDVSAVSIHSINGETLINSGTKNNNNSIFDSTLHKPTMSISNDKKSWFFQSPIFQTEFIEDELFSDISSNSRKMTNNNHQILGWVSVELSLKRTKDLQKNTWINSTAIAIIILFITAMAAIKLGQSITQPIITLKNIVNQLKNGNLDIQANTGASGEIKSLETGINTMATALKVSHDDLEYRIIQSTSELRKTLSLLEDRNKQLNHARHEAEAANRAKSSFLANISHEVRTPLNGIYGFLQLLEATDLAPIQREYTENIEVSTKSLLSLLNDILDFSKLEFYPIQLNTKNFDLQKMLNESLNIFYPAAHKKGLKLISTIDEKIPKNLLGDANRMAQIIKNLVSNAVKFTDYGIVTVNISEYSDKIKNEDDTITLNICVNDTGPGIKKENQQTIFQPFSQIEENMNRQHDGTGLGLSIAKSLIELMGGRISINSTLNKGTCFSVILPVKIDSTNTEKINCHSAKDISINNITPMNILLADDNVINRQFLSIWLNKKNIHVDEASNGEEAIEYCKRNEYDLIFLDLHMPKVDGLQAIKTIRENLHSNSTTPIIAVTADATENTQKRLQHSEFNDCLIKPVLEEELLLIIEKWNKNYPTTTGFTKNIPLFASTKENKKVIVNKALGIKIASGNKDLWLDSLNTLLNRLNRQENELEKAIECDDTDMIQSISHNIAGAASYCGATALLQSAKQLELINTTTDNTTIRSRFETLSLAISDTIKWLESAND